MPDSKSSTLFALRSAARRRKRAEEERHASAVELRQRVLDAHEAGVSITQIAREAALARQSVYEMLGIRLLSRPRGTSLPRRPAKVE